MGSSLSAVSATIASPWSSARPAAAPVPAGQETESRPGASPLRQVFFGRTTMDIYSRVMPGPREGGRPPAEHPAAARRSGSNNGKPQTSQAALRRENGPINEVELRGLEPLTPT